MSLDPILNRKPTKHEAIAFFFCIGWLCGFAVMVIGEYQLMDQFPPPPVLLEFAGIALFFAPIFALFGAWQGGFLTGSGGSQRARSIEQITAELGMTPEPAESSTTIGYGSWLPLLMRDGSVVNAFSRKDGNDEFLLFDYSYLSDRGSYLVERYRYTQTVAARRVYGWNLPTFDLQPKIPWWHLVGVERSAVAHHPIKDWIIGRLGFRDPTMPRKIGLATHPNFARSYHLYGTEEAAVRDLFTTQMLRHLSCKRGWWVEGCGEWLIAYRWNKRIAPRGLLDFVQQSVDLLALFSQP